MGSRQVGPPRVIRLASGLWTACGVLFLLVGLFTPIGYAARQGGVSAGALLGAALLAALGAWTIRLATRLRQGRDERSTLVVAGVFLLIGLFTIPLVLIATVCQFSRPARDWFAGRQ